MQAGTILTDRIIQAFSWMLIHSLWQGLLFAVIAGVVLMITNKARAAVRYNLTLLLFSFFLLGSACTFFYEWNGLKPVMYPGNSNLSPLPYEVNYSDIKTIPAVANNVNSPVSQPSNLPATQNIQTFIKAFTDYFSANSFLIVMLWFIFFTGKSVSMISGMVYMQRARHYQIYSPSEYWKERVVSLCEKLQLKRAVLLFESGYVKVPVVIGYLKPIILVPAGLIAGLPAAQVEAVLLHELAHIRRNDYVVNFLQNVSEAIFFFNPGLLWISSRLKEERENCCDDIAIAQIQNKEEFVKALISFKEYSISAPRLAVAFAGQKSSLVNRVMRIAYQENRSFSNRDRNFFMTSIVVFSIIAFSLIQIKNSEQIQQELSAISNKLKTSISTQLGNFSAHISGVGDALKLEGADSNASPEGKAKEDAITPSLRQTTELNAKWDGIWNEFINRRVPKWDGIESKYQGIQADHVKKWVNIWAQNNKQKSVFEKSEENTRISELLIEQSKEAEDISNKQNLEGYSLMQAQRIEVSLLSAMYSSEKYLNSEIVIPDPESEQIKAGMSRARALDAGQKRNELSRYEDELYQKKNETIREWKEYLGRNPAQNMDYYRNINIEVRRSWGGEFNIVRILAVAYLAENPKGNESYYSKVLEIGSAFSLRMAQTNSMRAWMESIPELNDAHFKRMFARDDENSQRFIQLQSEANTAGEGRNAEYIRKLIELNLGVMLKSNESNNRNNQAYSEDVAESFRKRLNTKPIIRNSGKQSGSILPDIVIPGTFSPDGDGINDVLAITVNSKTNIRSFEINDYFGKSVFLTKDISKSWDGTYQDNKVPAGAYRWFLSVVDDENKQFKKMGTVIITR